MPDDPERSDAPASAAAGGAPPPPPPPPAPPASSEPETTPAPGAEAGPAAVRDADADAGPSTPPASTPAPVESPAPAPAAAPAPVSDAPAAATAAEPAAAQGRRPFVHRHHWIVRLTHWVNAVVLVGMMGSGLQIYGAYERFGIRGTRLPLPNPLDMHPAPHWARLGGWLGGGINWHFFLMWPLVLNALLYLGYLLFSGEWRPLLFRPRDVRPALEMQKYYLHLRREHPAQGKHNALQKGAYSFIVLLGVLSVLSGLALWKPIQLPWLTALFGGYELARYWHFVAVWLFAAFIVVHVVLVFAVDPASLRAMITGWYRGRFPSHD
jgi:thiosulfate reductase cytochrome b subunit